ISLRGNSCLPADHQESAPHSEIEADFEHARVLGDCCALAYPGGTCKSPANGSGRHEIRFSLVLLRQRAVPALSRQACSCGLRHGSLADFLGPGHSLARTLDGLLAARLATSALENSPMARAVKPGSEGIPVLRDLGHCDRGLLHLLDAAGVL